MSALIFFGTKLNSVQSKALLKDTTNNKNHLLKEVEDSPDLFNDFYGGNEIQRHIISYGSGEDYTTVCWLEITTITEHQNGTTTVFREFGIILESSAEIPREYEESNGDVPFEIYDEDSQEHKTYKFKVIGETALATVYENRRIKCDTGKLYTKEFMRWPSSNRKRIGVKVSPLKQQLSVVKGVARKKKEVDEAEEKPKVTVRVEMKEVKTTTTESYDVTELFATPVAATEEPTEESIGKVVEALKASPSGSTLTDLTINEEVTTLKSNSTTAKIPSKVKTETRKSVSELMMQNFDRFLKNLNPLNSMHISAAAKIMRTPKDIQKQVREQGMSFTLNAVSSNSGINSTKLNNATEKANATVKKENATEIVEVPTEIILNPSNRTEEDKDIIDNNVGSESEIKTIASKEEEPQEVVLIAETDNSTVEDEQDLIEIVSLKQLLPILQLLNKRAKLGKLNETFDDIDLAETNLVVSKETQTLGNTTQVSEQIQKILDIEPQVKPDDFCNGKAQHLIVAKMDVTFEYKVLEKSSSKNYPLFTVQKSADFDLVKSNIDISQNSLEGLSRDAETIFTAICQKYVAVKGKEVKNLKELSGKLNEKNVTYDKALAFLKNWKGSYGSCQKAAAARLKKNLSKTNYNPQVNGSPREGEYFASILGNLYNALKKISGNMS